MVEQIQPFIVALLIGFVVGVERERRKAAASMAMGVRSFMLLGLLGALAAFVGSQPIAAVIALFAIGAILLGYLRTTRDGAKKTDLGLTSEIAGTVVFALGYMARAEPALAMSLGVVVLVILLSRGKLHHFTQHELRGEELRAAAIILVLAIVIAPFFPDATVDPWELFNPRRFIIILVMLAGIQFGGYVALRLWGATTGLALIGFLGGLVSSTVVFLNLSRSTRKDSAAQPGPVTPLPAAVTSGILATMATLLELAVLIITTNPALGFKLGLPLFAMVLAGGGLAAMIHARNGAPVGQRGVPVANPLDIKAAVKLAVVFSVMLGLSAVAYRLADKQALYLVSLLGGFFELQSVSMATMAMHAEGKLADNVAVIAVGCAVLASYLSKLGILWTLNRGRFAVYTTAALLVMVAAGAVTGILMVR